MADLKKSILKRLKAFPFFKDNIDVNLPLGNALLKISNAKYGDQYSIIAHGGGGFLLDSGHAEVYTNSKEAIYSSIEDGKKLIEIDLAITSDGKVVGVHCWKELKARIGYLGMYSPVLHNDDPMSYEEVMSIDFGSGIRPICMDEINKIWTEHRDIILLTDKISDLVKLKEVLKYPERTIVEVFCSQGYREAVSLGFDNIVLNVDIRKRGITKWILDNNIKAVTISAQAVYVHPRGYHNAIELIEMGIISLAYTSNNDDFLKYNIGKTVSAVYTDYWSLKKRKSCVPGGQLTY